MDLLADVRHRDLKDDRPFDCRKASQELLKMREFGFKVRCSPTAVRVDPIAAAGLGIFIKKATSATKSKIRRVTSARTRNRCTAPTIRPRPRRGGRYKMSQHVISRRRAFAVPDTTSPRAHHETHPARNRATSAASRSALPMPLRNAMSRRYSISELHFRGRILRIGGQRAFAMLRSVPAAGRTGTRMVMPCVVFKLRECADRFLHEALLFRILSFPAARAAFVISAASACISASNACSNDDVGSA